MEPWPKSSIPIALLDSLLKGDKVNLTRIRAEIMETTLNTIDSVRNWPINCFLNDPRTLRIPTSLARPDDRAVERFIKLMQAIMMINTAIAVKM
jgi:hypothetical protein